MRDITSLINILNLWFGQKVVENLLKLSYFVDCTVYLYASNKKTTILETYLFALTIVIVLQF